MSLTKEIIEYLHGQIYVTSKLGQGTKFNIVLPIINNQNKKEFSKFIFVEKPQSPISYNLPAQILEEPEQIKYVFENSKTQNTEQPKLLIVEDDNDLRNYIKSCFLDEYSVFEASNGKDALLLANSEQPLVVISDIMMPVMDGMEFCKQIKSNFSTSHIPVILLSAKTTLDTQLEGFETGADAYIPKPFNKQYLITRVKAIIKSRAKLREIFQKKLSIEPKEITVTTLDEQFVVKSKEIVEKNINNSTFGVDELATEMAMSRTLLHLKFKKLTNCSTGEFIKILRLKRACQLLKHKTYRVSDVCFMVGYSNVQIFIKAFKKHFGETPGQYAKRMNNVN